MKSPLDWTGGKGRVAASEEYEIGNMRPSTSNALTHRNIRERFKTSQECETALTSQY